MTLGALVDAGAPLDELRDGLRSLRVPGFAIRATRADHGSIAATQVHVDLDPSSKEVERRLPDVLAIIDAATALPERARARARAVFQRLAAAEGKVHGIPAEAVHFHEVG